MELKSKCRNPIRPLVLDLQLRESLHTYQQLLEAEKPEIRSLVGIGYPGNMVPAALEVTGKDRDRKKLPAAHIQICLQNEAFPHCIFFAVAVLCQFL